MLVLVTVVYHYFELELNVKVTGTENRNHSQSKCEKQWWLLHSSLKNFEITKICLAGGYQGGNELHGKNER